MNYRSLLKKYQDRGLREVENNLQVCVFDNFSFFNSRTLIEFLYDQHLSALSHFRLLVGFRSSWVAWSFCENHVILTYSLYFGLFIILETLEFFDHPLWEPWFSVIQFYTPTGPC